MKLPGRGGTQILRVTFKRSGFEQSGRREVISDAQLHDCSHPRGHTTHTTSHRIGC